MRPRIFPARICSPNSKILNQRLDRDHFIEHAHGKIVHDARPDFAALRVGNTRRIDTQQIYAAQNERKHGGVEGRPTGESARRDAAAKRNGFQHARQSVAAHVVDRRGPAFASSGRLDGVLNVARSTISLAPSLRKYSCSSGRPVDPATL